MPDSDWLPYEFSGARSFEEALGDLRTIARATDGWSEVRASRAPGTFENGAWNLGERDRYAGYLEEHGDDTFGVRSDAGVEMLFTVSSQTFRSAGLQTHDDADYYNLMLELVDARIDIVDGYNGYN